VMLCNRLWLSRRALASAAFSVAETNARGALASSLMWFGAGDGDASTDAFPARRGTECCGAFTGLYGFGFDTSDEVAKPAGNAAMPGRDWWGGIASPVSTFRLLNLWRRGGHQAVFLPGHPTQFNSIIHPTHRRRALRRALIVATALSATLLHTSARGEEQHIVRRAARGKDEGAPSQRVEPSRFDLMREVAMPQLPMPTGPPRVYIPAIIEGKSMKVAACDPEDSCMA
jgi:hypothetical protein